MIDDKMTQFEFTPNAKALNGESCNIITITKFENRIKFTIMEFETWVEWFGVDCSGYSKLSSMDKSPFPNMEKEFQSMKNLIEMGYFSLEACSCL